MAIKEGTANEVLTFTKGEAIATVVTDGLHHASYEPTGRTWHSELWRAIAHLESKGYSIRVDAW